jgi:polyphosphate kinase
MTDVEGTVATSDVKQSERYFNRELSWLEFNHRVLQEAWNSRNPLLERLKFTAIFSSNLDEFFMVRISTLKEQAQAGLDQLTPDGRTPQQQLDEIDQHLRPLLTQQHQHFEDKLRPDLVDAGIYLLNYRDLSQDQQRYFQEYFEKRIFPVLTPLAVDPGHPFPQMSNLSLNLAVIVKNSRTDTENFARVKVPDILPRFLPIPRTLYGKKHRDAQWIGVPLEQIITHNLTALFPGMDIQESCAFRVTRNADFPLREDEADDLLREIEQEISKRHFKGFVVRLEIASPASQFLQEALMRGLNVKAEDLYKINGLLNLNDLMTFLSLPISNLKDPPWNPVVPPRLARAFHLHRAQAAFDADDGEDFFSVIRRGDLLVHHPYESFADSVQLFVTQAAIDPDVLAIKMTLYRTSGDSPIIQALIDAAENRKQVAALVELKARFDEENNIHWAHKLEDAGVHVIYGLVGLKTHTKILLVVRQEGDEIRRYVHIGTGNYNPKTARLYTDLGLFSCREELGADLTDLFNYLTGYSAQHTYRKLLVAPVNMRDRMLQLIQREINFAKSGVPGRIIAKMNSLVDPEMIDALYEASQAGVEIDLIIRGICCLRPGLQGISETIRVISIVGRYLEHSRIFYFHNNDQPDLFIGSADWMPRNLNRRVEAITPVEDAILIKRLTEMLNLFLSDNRQTWELQSDGRYQRRHHVPDEPEISAQIVLMEQTMQLNCLG